MVTKRKPRKKKKEPAPEKCDYRNYEKMPGRDDLYWFEVQDKGGTWHRIRNLGGDNAEARLEMVKKTAIHYGKKKL